MIDAFLSLNKYKRMKIVKKKDAIYVLLMRLILMNPGDIQSHPKMGVGLHRYYRYMETESELSDLKLNIQQQIATYLPQLQGVVVDIEQDRNIPERINFYITVNDNIYNFSEENGKIIEYIV